MHRGLGNRSKALVVEDIVEKVNSWALLVFGLMGEIGQYMYRQLHPEEKLQFCGIYKGRFYTRKVMPEAEISRQSGVCDALRWFEDESGYRCPLAESCKAYERAIQL